MIISPFQPKPLYDYMFLCRSTLHCSHCFAGSKIPFGIIFGGTDVNEDVKCEEKHRVMGAVLEEAR